MKKFLQKHARKFGIKLSRLNDRNDLWYLLESQILDYKTNVMIDVGANEGQFISKVMSNSSLAFEKIYSFEPLPDAFANLQNRVQDLKTKSKIQTFNIALGDKNETQNIYVAPNSVSSSLLPVADGFKRHLELEEEAQMQKIGIPVERFEDFAQSLFPSLDFKKDKCFLKLDVQGFEKHVLEGFGPLLDHVPLALLECSLVEIYRDRPLMGDMFEYMTKKGFHVAGIFPGYFDDETRQLFEVDVVFAR
ncbi:FkbM family methyltransferase [Shimia sp. R9_3]|uniref:FkbM family methyltransferase n=1 Tax=Shimia sp. R9_3 TaxID=2821113 RepID=UPI001ADB90DC|nr:FkbM family methyltransferase [Shimia sp. R9_3]MBO9399402.1 FkbM family methyltransferase [Shimia sp. R9_3]